MLKSIVLGFLFISCVSSFSYNMQLLNNKNDKPRVNLKRRDCIKVIPLIVAPFLSAKSVSAEEKSIEQLREEANRIIEIIDAQKEAFNLPTLKKPDELVNTNSTSDNASSSVDGFKEVSNVLDNVMHSFKNNNASVSINNLKLHCAPSNPLKVQNTNNLVNTFNNSKYAILLGKFYNYSYVNYEYNYDNEYNMSYYTVDIKVEADYKTMIYNSIQFDDMYYPESNPNNNNMCYVIYRWTLKKDDNDYLIDSCYLIPK